MKRIIVITINVHLQQLKHSEQVDIKLNAGVFALTFIISHRHQWLSCLHMCIHHIDVTHACKSDAIAHTTQSLKQSLLTSTIHSHIPRMNLWTTEDFVLTNAFECDCGSSQASFDRIVLWLVMIVMLLL